MSILEIQQERDTPEGVDVVTPLGEIDISNVEVLNQVLGEVLSEQPRRLLVDLDRVSYVDSAGISTLLRAGQQMKQKGGQLSLIGGSVFVKRLIRLTGLDRVFPHFETIAAAIGAGSASPDGEALPTPDRGAVLHAR